MSKLKVIQEMLIIMLCYLAGELIMRLFHLMIPGNVIGMFILLILLLSGILKVEQVATVADGLIKNLSIFFVPVGVGIMLHFDLLARYATAIVGATVISTILVLIVTGHSAQYLITHHMKGVERDV